ncbi:MAG: family 78 glycoside hydrolase catalytic domain [Armatimonadota bacterium]
MGNWIWIQSADAPRNYYLYTRKVFDLPAKPTEAVIKASADSRYKLFVNGHYVGKGPMRSASTHSHYDTYNITQLLNKGKNVIAFLVHHFGEDTSFCPKRRPGLLCRAEIEIGEEKQVVVTDETWKVHHADDWTNQGARINESLGFQEVYDSAGRMEGWNEVKFREKDWQDAVVVGAVSSQPWGELIERSIPALQEEKILPKSIVGLYNSPDRTKEAAAESLPESMAASELANLTAGNVKHPEALLIDDGTAQVKTPRGDRGVVIVLDFGREVFGNVEVGIGGSGTGTIDLGYSEVLEDGRVKPNRGEMKHADRVILKKGRLEWQGFEPRAFRYLQIEFRRCSKTVALDHVRVNQTTYPVELMGDFECSDNLLNEIWRIGAYTAHLCMEDTFIDCPSRDRAQWWVDARIVSRTAYYAFDDTDLLAQGLRQFASTQDCNGAIMGMYPGGEDKLIPDFALHWVFSILDYYAFSDDSGLVRELYPNVRRLMDWFGRYVGENGLISDVPGWLFIDSADVEKRGTVTALNCMYYQALRVTTALAAIQSKETDAQDYDEAARKLRLAINKYLYSPEHALYAECIVDGKLVETYSRQANIYAALFDIPNHYQKAAIIRWLLEGPMPEIITPFFMSHMLEMLYSMDRHAEALDIIRKKWGEIVKSGDGTFHEFFGREGSRCHGWASGPTRDLVAEYVGIKPVLGAHRFSVTPHEGGLTWAKGTVATKTGPLTVEWQSTPRMFTIDVQIPEGLKVDVYPPRPMNTKMSVNGKNNPSSMVTLSSGHHQIRVTAARLTKPKMVDISSKLVPIPTVELLDELSVSAQRSLGLTISRRGERVRSGRPRRDTRKGTETAEEILPVELLPAPEWDATVGENEIIPEVTGAGEEGESAAETAKKARRRRSRRGRGRSKLTPEESAIAQVPAEPEASEIISEAAEIEPSPEAEGAISTEEAPKRSSRRRSRRGGRRRSGTPASDSETPAEGGSEPIAETMPEPVSEPVDLEATTEPTGEEPARRRRSHRGGRRRSAAKRQASEEQTEPGVDASALTEHREEPAPEPAPQPTIEASSEEAPKKKRRAYTRRPKKSASAEPGSGEGGEGPAG